MKSLTVVSPAKINIYLNVKSKRRDGFHNIETFMEKISLVDYITFKPNNLNRVRLFCTLKELENEQNLALKAARLIVKKFKIKQGFDIFLKKNIPYGAGLGGASSNAAAVITGLNEWFDLGLNLAQKYQLGRQLGSDVNFFISSASFALARGKGDIIETINTDLKLKKILVIFKENNPTFLVYKKFKVRLTKYLDNVKLLTYALKNKDENLISSLIFNSLSNIALGMSKTAKRAVNLIIKSGCSEVKVGVTGSGSSIFFTGQNLNKIKNLLIKEGFMLKEVYTF